MSALALGGADPTGGGGAYVHYFGGLEPPVASSTGPSAGAGSDPINSTFKQLVDALQSVSGEQTSLNGAAKHMEVEGAQVSPSEMVMLSMRCNEFMFHCELTSSAANQSSNGLQELFKEQS